MYTLVAGGVVREIGGFDVVCAYGQTLRKLGTQVVVRLAREDDALPRQQATVIDGLVYAGLPLSTIQRGWQRMMHLGTA